MPTSHVAGVSLLLFLSWLHIWLPRFLLSEDETRVGIHRNRWIASATQRYGSPRRSNRAVVAAAVLMLLAAFGPSSCGGGSSSKPFGASGSAGGAAIVSATDLGVIAANPDILGRDGGYSATFQGQAVWIYGDTFLGKPDAEGRTLISDSWSFTPDLTVANGAITGFQERLDSSGAPTMILQETAAETAYDAAHAGNPCQEQPCGARWALWPSWILTNSADNQALIFYMLVSAAPGAFNFQAVGNSVAIWQSFAGLPQRPTLNPPIVADHPDLLFMQNEPNFGTAALISNGTLYAYGCGLPTNGADKGCRLGKVDPANVETRSAWTFYAGNETWSVQSSDAVSVFVGGSIASVAWNNFLQRYVVIYSPPFSQNVMMRTAPNPEGPWSNEVTAFVAMQPVSGSVYDAHQHPDYDVNGGQTVYVTYSRATGAFTSEVRLVAVQFANPQ